MKKFCLLAVFLLSVATLFAANTASWNTATYASDQGWVSGTTKVGDTAIRVNDDISFTITDYGTAPLFSGSALRIYKSSKVTFSGATGVKITSMSISCESASYAPEPYTVSSGSVTKNSATLTWSGSTNNLVITNNASTQLRVTGITFTYTGGTGGSSSGDNGSDGTSSESGNVVYFIAPEYTGHTGTKLLNSDGSTSVSSGTASASLVGKTFSAMGVTLSVARTSGSYTASFGNFVRWYANNTITLTPASGYKITRIEIPYSGTSYKGPFTTTTGSVDSSSNPVVWSGEASSALTLTPSGQMRFAYVAVTVEKTTSSGGNNDQFTPIYILGDMNNWTPSSAWKFSTTDGVHYTLNVSNMPAVSEFKIADPTYSIANWGGCTSIRPNIEYYMLWDQGNATMDAISANATITFNTQTHGFKVSSSKVTGGMKAPSSGAEGWPYQYEGVMLQGFYWDSYDDTNWANLEYQATELAQFFKLIWLPNSAKPASDPGMGYDPVYWFSHYDSAFGSERALRSLAKTLKAKGTGLIADVVVNHRSGQSNWTDFPAETWNGITYSLNHKHICSNDEVAWASGQPTPGGNYDTGDNFDGSRDLDHTNALVQSNIKAYCQFLLEDIGYAGFRWDMVKGYGGGYIKLYNDYSVPTYSVGEYFDMSFDNVGAWIESTGRTSAAFDFPFKNAVNDAFHSGDLTKLVWNGQPAGLIHNIYQRYAVTFVDNHDTARDNNNFHGNIPAANAFMLMSPGTPCVFLPHWKQYKNEIAHLIALRNSVGIHNCSAVQVLRSTSDCYMAKVFGKYGDAIVKIGPAMVTPDGFNDADLKAYGPDYAVWTKVHVSGAEIPHDFPSKLFLIGNVNTNNWSTTNPIATSSVSNGVYTWNNVTIAKADGANYGYFSLISAKGANWDVVNASHRFGAYSDAEVINGTAGVKPYPANFNAAAAKNWALAPGQYKIVVDMSAMTITATAIGSSGTQSETSYFITPDYTGATGTKLLNANGTSAGSASNSLLNLSFTSGKVTLTSTGGGSSKAAAYGSLVRWYKGNVLSLSAQSGYEISRVEVGYSGSSYAGPFTANTGTVNASTNPVIWTGSASSLNLTASGQMRVTYIAVTVVPSSGSSESSTSSKEAFYEPVKYLSELTVGDSYILVAPSASKAMGFSLSKGSTGYLNTVPVTVATDKTVYAADCSDIMEFTLERGTNSTSYAIKFVGDDDNEYYLAVPSASTTLSRTATKSTSNNITVTISGNTSTLLFSKNSRRLNYGTANSGCFQAYAASSASKLAIYKKRSNRASAISNAHIVNFIAPANEDVDNAISLINSDGSETASGTNQSAATLYNEEFVASNSDGQTICTLQNTYAKTYYPGAYADHVRWYKNAVFTVTPGEGLCITRVEVEYVDSYSGPFSCESGEITTNTDTKTIIWSGNSSALLELTATDQIRFSSLSVTLIQNPFSRPAIDNFEAPEGEYVLLDNEAEWEHPYAYTWTTDQSDENAPWPGVAMTRVSEGSDMWYYNIDESNAPTYIIFNDGVVGSTNQTEDLNFVNATEYTNIMEGIHEIYLVGDFTDNWSFLDQYRFESEDGITYSLDVPRLNKNSVFKVASKFYAPLDFGGSAHGINIGCPVTLEQNSSVNNLIGQDIKNANVNFNIDTAEFLVNGQDGSVTGIEDADIDLIDPVYYNLQGVRVEKPVNGIYIEVRGNIARKVIF